MKKIMILLLFVMVSCLCSVNSVMAEKKYDYNGLNVNSSAFLRDRKEVSMKEYERNYNNLTPEKKAGPIGQNILKQWAEVQQRYDQKIKAAEEAEAYYENLKKQK